MEEFLNKVKQVESERTFITVPASQISFVDYFDDINMISKRRVKSLTLEIGKKQYRMTNHATAKLHSMLQVPYPFSKYYSESFGLSDWASLVNKLKAKAKAFQGEVNCRVENDQLTGVFRGALPIFKMEDFSGVVESCMEAKSLLLEKWQYSNGLWLFDFMRTKDFKVGKAFEDPKKEDLLKTGMALTFDENMFSLPHITPYFYRLVCLNGMIAKTKQETVYMRLSKTEENIERVKQICHNYADRDYTPLIKERIELLKKYNYSVLEIESMCSALGRFKEEFEEGKTIPILAEVIETLEVPAAQFATKKYGLSAEDELSDKSKAWKGTADSGISAYVAYNTLTNTATHNKAIRVEDRRILSEYASGLLMKTPILADVAIPVEA